VFFKKFNTIFLVYKFRGRAMVKGKYDLIEDLDLNSDEIVCRTCRYKASGIKINRGQKQYTMCFCEKYVYPNTKPVKVLFENKDCYLYKKE